ncbi:copper chaperone PCu(A)C [Undibacterium sp. TJN19]|uniref:copper chaperone PCu(A)C n=1 Tax=Undibacterium sp. TJN19 TaxID=3413055 RepID=UPI003BF2FDC7
MKLFRQCLAACALSFVSYLASAEVIVKDAWIRATVVQQHATGAFMQIQSSKDVRLLSVQTEIAGIAEIHEMKMENNLIKMREISHLEIPAGKTIELKPGSLHLMLMDLKGQVKPGDNVTLKLKFESKDKKTEIVEVKAQAKALNEPVVPGKM